MGCFIVMFNWQKQGGRVDAMADSTMIPTLLFCFFTNLPSPLPPNTLHFAHSPLPLPLPSHSSTPCLALTRSLLNSVLLLQVPILYTAFFFLCFLVCFFFPTFLDSFSVSIVFTDENEMCSLVNICGLLE